MATSRYKCRLIVVAVLMLSLLSTTLLRGCWTIAQCLHDEVSPRYVLEVNDEPHFHHHQHTHAEAQMDDATHSALHMMDSIEFSLPPLLSDSRVNQTRYPALSAIPPRFPDYDRARLYRPPRLPFLFLS